MLTQLLHIHSSDQEMRPPVLPKIISKKIWFNGIIDLEGARFLKQQGVTHVLSLVGAYAQHNEIEKLGMEILKFSVSDQRELTTEGVLPIMRAIDKALQGDDSKIYIHCHAGQLRAPTITWLYLIYAGASEQYATDRMRSIAKIGPAQHLVRKLDLMAIRDARNNAGRATPQGGETPHESRQDHSLPKGTHG